jgi:putative methyltransferase
MRMKSMRKKKKGGATGGAGGEENEVKTAKLKGAERSAYFARREAAKILRSVLDGDAKRRALASIKTLVYHPSVRNKKATFALICQTLKRN